MIENKPGAAGTMGASAMINAKPDGYTITQIPITVFRYPHMAQVGYDPLADLTYIIGISGYTFGVVVRSDAPWKTWQELVAYAKANPGKLSYGTPGANTSLHVTMEDIAQRDGIQWVQVPYKGNADNMTGAARRPHPGVRGRDRLGAARRSRQDAAARHVGRRSARSGGPTCPP